MKLFVNPITIKLCFSISNLWDISFVLAYPYKYEPQSLHFEQVVNNIPRVSNPLHRSIILNMRSLESNKPQQKHPDWIHPLFFSVSNNIINNSLSSVPVGGSNSNIIVYKSPDNDSSYDSLRKSCTCVENDARVTPPRYWLLLIKHYSTLPLFLISWRFSLGGERCYKCAVIV